MPGFFTDGELASDPGTIFDYDVTSGEAFGAGFGRQFDTNPLALVARQARYLSEDMQALAGGGNFVDQETARAEVTSRGLDLKIPAGGISRQELDMLQYLKQREIEQNVTTARSRGIAPTAAGFAGGIAASLTDPINVASNFIPIVSQARYAQWLARAGEGVLVRAAVRAGAGAIEGAVGSALIEPIVYTGATSEQLDYGLLDSFLNVTLGGAIGGGLHAVGGAIYDRGAATTRLRDFAGAAPEQVKRDAMQAAVAALERGEAVDAESVFVKHLGDKYGVTDREFLDRAMDFDDAEFDAARSLVVMARGGEDAASPTSSLLQAVRMAGGIKVRNAAGELTREGAEVMAVLGDMRAPGLINNKNGKSPDYLREMLVEDGWLRADRDVSASDLQELYDALERVARGERVMRAGEERGTRLKGEAMETMARAGVTDADTMRQAAVKVAEMRARELRERANPDTGDLDFEPMEIIYREPGDENPLAAPQTLEELMQFEEFSGVGRGRNLSDLIERAKVERTEDAFRRQFVDKADETLAAEKARPKDKIESVRQDEAEFRDVVEEYRGQGRVTADDDNVLKQADELAGWAERRARAFEAAAGCIEAA